MHLGKLPDSLEFQSWKVNALDKRRVEIAESIDELLTSHYDMLDAMNASALKKLLTHVHFGKRVSVEDQRAQTYDRFLRGRQVAHMIHEHFQTTGAHEAVQGLSALFNTRLQNDDVQDFDTRWDQALLAASEIPTETVLHGLYKSKLQDSVQLQTALALYEHENIRNN